MRSAACSLTIILTVAAIARAGQVASSPPARPFGFVLAGETIAFDDDLRPHFTEMQNRETTEGVRAGFIRWARTETGKKAVVRFNTPEYCIVIREEAIEGGSGRAPQPAMAVLLAAGKRRRTKTYELLLDPAIEPPARAISITSAQPTRPAEVMAAAWAAEMLHIDFYSRGLSLPHHQRSDFQAEWRRVALELGFPALRHDDGGEREVQSHARVIFWEP